MFPTPTQATFDDAYRLGRKTLAPVFFAFVTLLLAECTRRGHRQLIFLARDGDFLLQATEPFAAQLKMSPQLVYAYLTRRSTALAACNHLDAYQLAATAERRAGQVTWGSALAHYGINPNDFADLLAVAGVAAESPLPETATIAGLLDRPTWRQRVAQLSVQRRDLLIAYLSQIGLDRDSRSVLVDIGWQASIQNHLSMILADRNPTPCPPGIYFGLWSESASACRSPLDAIGLISDLQRGRRPSEAAAWYVAFLLEAICRADEGTTIGYEQRAHAVEAVLAGESASRNAESQSQSVVRAIRQGIVDGMGEQSARFPTDEQHLRRSAQRHLLRLAFFPGASEIAVARHLVHTEGHDLAWHSPLVLDPSTHPICAPRRWLAGLASPWRAGYVRASAGLPGAILFALAEASLIALPPSTRIRLQSLALRVARLPPATPQ